MINVESEWPREAVKWFNPNSRLGDYRAHHIKNCTRISYSSNEMWKQRSKDRDRKREEIEGERNVVDSHVSHINSNVKTAMRHNKKKTQVVVVVEEEKEKRGTWTPD